MPPFARTAAPAPKKKRPTDGTDQPSTENGYRFEINKDPAPVYQHRGSNDSQSQSEVKPPVGTNALSRTPSAPRMVVEPTAQREMASKPHMSAYDKLKDRAVTRRGYY